MTYWPPSRPASVSFMPARTAAGRSACAFCAAIATFTIERVKDAVAASAGLGAEGVATLILEKTRAWADEVAADDLTVVLVDCA